MRKNNVKKYCLIFAEIPFIFQKHSNDYHCFITKHNISFKTVQFKKINHIHTKVTLLPIKYFCLYLKTASDRYNPGTAFFGLFRAFATLEIPNPKILEIDPSLLCPKIH